MQTNSVDRSPLATIATAAAKSASPDSALGALANFASLLGNVGLRMDVALHNAGERAGAAADQDLARQSAKRSRNEPSNRPAERARDDRPAARAADNRQDTRVDDRRDSRRAERSDRAGPAQNTAARTDANAPAKGNDGAKETDQTLKTSAQNQSRQGDGQEQTQNIQTDQSNTAAQTQTVEVAAPAMVEDAMLSAQTGADAAMATVADGARTANDPTTGRNTTQGPAAVAPEHRQKVDPTLNAQAPGDDEQAALRGRERGEGRQGTFLSAANAAQAKADAAQAGQGAQGTENQTLQQQAAGLADAAGRGKDMKVKVNVTNQAATVQSQPIANLTNAAALGEQVAETGTRQGPARTDPNSGNPFAGNNNGSQTAQQNGQMAANAAFAANAQGQPGQTGQSFQAAMADGRGVAGAQQAGASSQPAAVGGDQGIPGGSNGTSQTQHLTKPQQAQQAHRPQHPMQAQVIEQVTVNITKAVQAGQDKIQIHLRPEHLGRIEVRLEMLGNGKVNATVIADRPETLDILRQDARGLERALADAGLNTKSGDMNFSLRGEQNHNQADGSKDGGNGKGAEDQTAENGQGEAAADQVMTAGEAALLGLLPGGISPSGHVDIRA